MSMTRTAAIAMVIGLLGGCSEPGLTGPPYRAEVLDLVSVDPETEQARFALAAVELAGLDDFGELAGQSLKVTRGGFLDADAVQGSVVDSPKLEGGRPNGLRYDVMDGVAVARDYPTLVMMSAYHQFQRVFAELPRVTGSSFDELATGWPRLEVFFEPEFRASSASAALRFNAFYVSGERQFGLAQRSDRETVPLAGNQLVIAHEFGHLLFEKLLLLDAREPCADPLTLSGRLDVEYAIAGLNEGFADFMSFAVTGGTNTLAGEIRLDWRSLARREYVWDDLGSAENPCNGHQYCVGALFSRSLYESLAPLGLEPTDPADRGVLSRQVVTALAGTQATMAASGLLPAPSARILACEVSEAVDLTYDGQVVGAFLDGFLAGLPAETRAALCPQLARNFGPKGFPEEARGACPAQ